MRIAGDCKGIIGGCIDSRRVYRDYRGSAGMLLEDMSCNQYFLHNLMDMGL